MVRPVTEQREARSEVSAKRLGTRTRRLTLPVFFALALTTHASAEPQPATGTDAATTRREAPNRADPKVMTFRATAYALEGKTASGTIARKGVVAADPRVLPLGTRIRVTGAGMYSGEYVVEDTGPEVQGRVIDIWVESSAAARAFGRRSVQVEVPGLGPAQE